MDLRRVIKILLVIFVAVSAGVLIYKEFTPGRGSSVTNATEAETGAPAAAVESTPSPENRPLKALPAKQKEDASLSSIEKKAGNARVIAYYFHGSFRCTTCRTIEQYSHEAIQKHFAKELGKGKLEFRPVNVEEADNKHFIQDYQLVTRSLVLSLVSDGKEIKWKNLPDVWKLVGDKERFFQYVRDEVELFLQETR